MSAGSDSRKRSVYEASLNLSGGYPIGHTIGIATLPASVVWVERGSLTANLLITAVHAAERELMQEGSLY